MAASDRETDRLVLDTSAPVATEPRPHTSPRQLIAVVVLATGLITALAVQRPHDSTPRHGSHVDRARVDTAVVSPPGPIVSVLGYRFSLPTGMHVVRRHGPAPAPAPSRTSAAGRFAYVDARGSHSGLDVTVFAGAVARRVAAARDPAPMRVNRTTIAGYPATVDVFGAGPAGPSSLEMRVRVSRDVLVLVDSDSVASDVLVDMLATALTR